MQARQLRTVILTLNFLSSNLPVLVLTLRATVHDRTIQPLSILADHLVKHIVSLQHFSPAICPLFGFAHPSAARCHDGGESTLRPFLVGWGGERECGVSHGWC